VGRTKEVTAAFEEPIQESVPSPSPSVALACSAPAAAVVTLVWILAAPPVVACNMFVYVWMYVCVMDCTFVNGDTVIEWIYLLCRFVILADLSPIETAAIMHCQH
jgi:hypothetical protein